MPHTTILVTAATGDYPVHIGTDLLNLVGGAAGASRAFIVTSDAIAKHWLAPLSAGFAHVPHVLTVMPGEAHKRFATLERLAEELAQHGADRDSILIALGGGVIGDMTGFLAAIYMRGIRWIGVPTTVLAQVDSSLGGKTGANLAAGKNLVGAFHPPSAVFSDVATLGTLPPRELHAGLIEAVKAGIIRDRALFHFMQMYSDDVLALKPAAIQHIIEASVRVKAGVVARDERESGERMLLNLGHTLGHAIEAATGYTQLLHGEAVAWGMLAATFIASRRGLVSGEEAAAIARVTEFYGPADHQPLQPFAADADTLVALTTRDKKNRGTTRSFILPLGIGDATVVHDVGHDELLQAARHTLARNTLASNSGSATS